MKNKIIMFWVIIAIVLVSGYLVVKKPTKLGLDLVGGSRLILEAETTANIAKITPDVMQRLQYAIESRVNKLGVSETVVQQVGDKRLLIEIPDVTDLTEAKSFIGETAQLEFKKKAKNANGVEEWVSTGLTGQDLSKSTLTTDASGQWVVSLEFNSAGAKKFGELTEELVGQSMAIFFDGDLISDPRVNEPIYGGNAQITSGGIPMDETDSFQSKKSKGIYLCGELLDRQFPCGGYNLDFAWHSGITAADSITKECGYDKN